MISYDKSEILDLSSKSLTKIPSENEMKDVAFNAIISLRLSDNKLKIVEGIAKFTNVHQIIIFSNELQRLASFLPVKKHLQCLDISRNELHICDNLNSFLALHQLNLSHNYIQDLPFLDNLVHLTKIDLSHNQIMELPNLSRLINLTDVNLQKNFLCSLSEIHELMPENITHLNVANNNIIDLTEAFHLISMTRLNTLYFMGNSCIFDENRAYDYRPYLICCCTTLRNIDGFVVSETEQLRGEWLYCQGKGRKFKPGNGKKLTDYLVDRCPINNLSDRPLSTSLDDTVMKVMYTRRLHLQEEGERSVNQNQGKEPTVRNASKTSLEHTRNEEKLEAQRIFNKEEQELNEKQDEKENRAPTSSSSLPHFSQNSFLFKKSIPNLDSSCATSPNFFQKHHLSLSPSNSPKQIPSLRELECLLKIQAWWRGVLTRKAQYPKVTGLRAARADQYIGYLMDKVADLDDKYSKTEQLNANLTDLVEQMVEQMVTLKDTIEKTTLPMPENVTLRKLNDNSAIINWRMSCFNNEIHCYSVFLDGQFHSQVENTSNSTIITDIDFSIDHNVSVQAIFKHVKSAISNPVPIEKLSLNA